MNEYRLSPLEPKARKFLEAEMEKFFFGPARTAPPNSSRRKADSLDARAPAPV